MSHFKVVLASINCNLVSLPSALRGLTRSKPFSEIKKSNHNLVFERLML